MVILDVKRSEKKNEFLYETTVKVGISELLQELCEVHNLRLKVLRVAATCKELAKHGPIRPEETRGISDDLSKVRRDPKGGPGERGPTKTPENP